MLIDGVQWDDGNRDKCQKHGVSLAEIEFVLMSATLMVLPDPFPDEARLRGVGKTAEGRYVFLVWTERQSGGLNLLRPISARYMHRKEIEHYERSQNS
ncbi:MAG: hypothetical protein ABS76_36575 [Pelagibacterium sp. SCN 64-44]|nr:MAG: hypothetical protein ABS76_36575 [Pelagibacterium sp. SCN 64-44]